MAVLRRRRAVPDGFGGFQSSPPPLGTGAELPPVLSTAERTFPAGLRTMARNQHSRAEADWLRHGHGEGTPRQPDGRCRCTQLAHISRSAGDGLLARNRRSEPVWLTYRCGHCLKFMRRWNRSGWRRRGAPDRGHDHLSGSLQLQPGADQVHESGCGVGRSGAGLLRPAGPPARASRSAAAPTPAASIGSAILASTAMRARSTARKFLII